MNTTIQGDVTDTLKKLPSESIDMIFADPPYFMQTDGVLLRYEGSEFKGVDDEWDKFKDYVEYDKFCNEWLKECKRVLKKDGTIWVIGAFQNIYRIGYIMQNLGFWVLNDIIWNKSNPTPNFKGTRFTNASETILWCSKSKEAKKTFNYKTMKHLNDGKQMKSVWDIPLCTGSERIKDEKGVKVHTTQKPEKLLLNVILSSTKEGDIVLDPFMGSGTTGAIAKRTNRNFIGIEREKKYVSVTNKRISSEKKEYNNPIYKSLLDITPPRVPTSKLIEKGYLQVNEQLFDVRGNNIVKLTKTGHVDDGVETLSIHKMSAKILNLPNSNGWDFWFVKRNKKLISIDQIRKEFRKKELNYEDFKI